MNTPPLFTPKTKPISITPSHIQVFAVLYKYGRLDFPTLAHLLQNSPWKPSTLRVYLRQLQTEHYIHTFYGQRDSQPIFALLDRGLACYLETQNEPARRTTQPRHSDAERIRTHEVGLSKYLVAREQAIQSHTGVVSICHRDIFNQSLDKLVRQSHRLPVSFQYKGKSYRSNVVPDYVAGISVSGEPVRFRVTEFDASTETLAPTRFKTSPANILGKLVAYSAMVEQDVFNKYLGLDKVEIEFVFLSQRRRDNVVALALATIPNPNLASQFYFAVQPPCPIEHDDAYKQMQWIDGRGKLVERL